LSCFSFFLRWFSLCVASFQFSCVHWSFLFCSFSLLFFAHKFFFPSLLPSFFVFLSSFRFSLFPSFPHYCLAVIFLCFVFHCFTLLLHIPSFTFHLVATYSIFRTLPYNCLLPPSCFTLILLDASLTFHLATIYSLMFHLLLLAFSHFAYCYLFLLLHFTQLLFTPSFVLHLATTCSFLHIFTLLPTYSLLHVSPYYYMLPPLHFTLPLPTPSFVHYPTTTCFFLSVLLCYLPTPSHFIMLFLSQMLMLWSWII
jgi:hypothetical protein